MEDIRQLVAAIDALTSVDDVEQLQILENVINRFFASPDAAKHLDVWFRLLERFPEEDGYETFWSILHGIEAQPGYEPLVVESVRRSPSRFPVLMIEGMLNGGLTDVGDADLLELLRSVAAYESCPPDVRADAADFVRHHEDS